MPTRPTCPNQSTCAQIPTDPRGIQFRTFLSFLGSIHTDLQITLPRRCLWDWSSEMLQFCSPTYRQPKFLLALSRCAMLLLLLAKPKSVLKWRSELASWSKRVANSSGDLMSLWVLCHILCWGSLVWKGFGVVGLLQFVVPLRLCFRGLRRGNSWFSLVCFWGTFLSIQGRGLRTWKSAEEYLLSMWLLGVRIVHVSDLHEPQKQFWDLGFGLTAVSCFWEFRVAGGDRNSANVSFEHCGWFSIWFWRDWVVLLLKIYSEVCYWVPILVVFLKLNVCVYPCERERGTFLAFC